MFFYFNMNTHSCEFMLRVDEIGELLRMTVFPELPIMWNSLPKPIRIMSQRKAHSDFVTAILTEVPLATR